MLTASVLGIGPTTCETGESGQLWFSITVKSSENALATLPIHRAFLLDISLVVPIGIFPQSFRCLPAFIYVIFM